MKTAPESSTRMGGGGIRWLLVAGAAGLVFAARTREIHLFAGDTPFLDQWDAEARQILVPWLGGKLSWLSFFAPHNEHVPLWTRLSAWLQAAVLGRWDPQLQATINAICHATFVGIVAFWLRRNLPRWPAFALTLLLIVLAALPFSWENSTWGFQLQPPLALLLVFLHIRGSFVRIPGSPGWWFAQAAGVAALFTFGSMWAAPLAVMLTVWWTAAADRRRWIAAAVLSAAGLALVWYARSQQEPAHTLALTAHTPLEFLADFLVQLGWPNSWPGACALLWLPMLLFALQLRRRALAENFDRIVLALGVWAAAQAAAFAFARGGGYIGFVSRYGDLLALGVLANAIALWRLLQAVAWPRRWLAVGLAVAWLAVVAAGLNLVSTRGHTEYFHAHAAAWAKTRHEAVRQYLATKDISVLSTDEVRAILYPNPETVAQALDQATFVALLPATLRPTAGPEHGDGISAAAAWLRANWAWVAAVAGACLLLSLVPIGRVGRLPISELVLRTDHGFVSVCAAIAVAAAASIFLWPQPFNFNAEQRWRALVAPAGTVQGLSFHPQKDPSHPQDNFRGAAQLWPDAFRQQFFGTEIDGAHFTGIVESSLFPLTAKWLVIPFAGFPASPGNGLRLRIADNAGNLLDEIAYAGPNPTDVDFWPVDVEPFIGQSARILLYDGRENFQGWLAVAAPQATTRADLAANLRHDRALEPTRFGQESLAIIAVAAALFGAGSVLIFRRKEASRWDPRAG